MTDQYVRLHVFRAEFRCALLRPCGLPAVTSTLVLFWVLAAPAHAVITEGPPVPLTLINETASFEQTNFPIEETTDGVVTGSSNGWAIGGDQNSDQEAVYQTSTPIPAGNRGTKLTFRNIHGRGDAHLLGNYRLSVTTDPNPTAGGSATWFQLTPASATSLSGANLLIQPDNRIQWDLNNGAPTTPNFTDTYTVVATAPNFIAQVGITGFRLEAIADGSLMPITNVVGPGLTTDNGNFVLTEVTITAASINSSVPEPATGLLSAAAMAGMLVHRRRRYPARRAPLG